MSENEKHARHLKAFGLFLAAEFRGVPADEWRVTIIGCGAAVGVVEAIAAIGAERESLRAQLAEAQTALETEQMRLAACTVAALGNTPEAVAQRLQPGHPYYSASCGDVCSAVDREMGLTAQLAEARDGSCPCDDGKPDPCPKCGASAATGVCGVAPAPPGAVLVSREDAERALIERGMAERLLIKYGALAGKHLRHDAEARRLLCLPVEGQ